MGRTARQLAKRVVAMRVPVAMIFDAKPTAATIGAKR